MTRSAMHSHQSLPTGSPIHVLCVVHHVSLICLQYLTIDTPLSTKCFYVFSLSWYNFTLHYTLCGQNYRNFCRPWTGSIQWRTISLQVLCYIRLLCLRMFHPFKYFSNNKSYKQQCNSSKLLKQLSKSLYIILNSLPSLLQNFQSLTIHFKKFS